MRTGACLGRRLPLEPGNVPWVFCRGRRRILWFPTSLLDGAHAVLERVGGCRINRAHQCCRQSWWIGWAHGDGLSGPPYPILLCGLVVSGGEPVCFRRANARRWKAVSNGRG